MAVAGNREDALWSASSLPPLPQQGAAVGQADREANSDWLKPGPLHLSALLVLASRLGRPILRGGEMPTGSSPQVFCQLGNSGEEESVLSQRRSVPKDPGFPLGHLGSHDHP